MWPLMSGFLNVSKLTRVLASVCVCSTCFGALVQWVCLCDCFVFLMDVPVLTVSPLSPLVVLFSVSVLSPSSVATLAFLWLLFAWNIFTICVLFNLFVCLNLK